MLLVLDMYHTWKFLLNIWWPAGWRWKVNKGGWPCYSRRQWLPHSSSQMEHVKKVDPGPGERWVDLYDALRINPTQALHTHNVKVVWKCDSVTSSLFSIGILWDMNFWLDTIQLFLLIECTFFFKFGAVHFPCTKSAFAVCVFGTYFAAQNLVLQQFIIIYLTLSIKDSAMKLCFWSVNCG